MPYRDQMVSYPGPAIEPVKNLVAVRAVETHCGFTARVARWAMNRVTRSKFSFRKICFELQLSPGEAGGSASEDGTGRYHVKHTEASDIADQICPT